MSPPELDPQPLPFARIPRGAWALAVGLAFGGLLAASWLRWPDVNVDFGRELYGAWRVSEGDVPGRDLRWLNGPLSLWVNGGLFALFGPSLHGLVALNLAVGLGVAALALRLYGRRGDRGLALVQALVLAGVFAFGQSAPVGNYCFPTPYSHELTHGLLLALLALERARAFVRAPEAHGALGRLVVSGLAAGLALLTKVEVAVALVPALGLLFALARGAGGARGAGAKGGGLRRIGVWGVAAALPVLAAWAALVPALGAGGAGRVVLGGWLHVGDGRVTDLPFYRQMLGLDRPAENVRLALERGAAYALALAALSLGALAAGRVLRRRAAGHAEADARDAGHAAPRSAAVPALALLIGTALSAWGLSRGSFWHLARPLPLFLLVVLAGHALRYLRARRARDVAGARASAAHLGAEAFALFLLARTGLAPTTVFYGFALALPATTEVVAGLLHDGPRALARRLARSDGGAGPPSDLAGVRAALAGAVLAFAGVHVARSATFWAPKDVVVGTGADRFRAADRAPEVVAAIEHLARTSDPGGTLLVLPEGALGNYLLRRRSPAPQVNFMPPEMILWGEAPLLEVLRAAPPDRVLLIHKDTREYGRGAFGRGYAVELMEWVHAHYEREALFGALPLVSSAYGVAVLRPREGH